MRVARGVAGLGGGVEAQRLMHTLPASDLSDPTQIRWSPPAVPASKLSPRADYVRTSSGFGRRWSVESFMKRKNQSIPARDHPEINGARRLRRGFEQMHIY